MSRSAAPVVLAVVSLTLLAAAPAAAAPDRPPPLGADAAVAGPVAEVVHGDRSVVWTPLVEAAGATLTVHTPRSTLVWTFGPGEMPSFDPAAVAAGSGAPDGLYRWEMRIVTPVDPATRAVFERARTTGDAEIPLALRHEGRLPPVVDLHVVDGHEPALRLEQDGSSGFSPQTWDVAGNDDGFFVRDVTHGARLPLRVRAGAPQDALFVDADGAVGLGTGAPAGALHVARTAGDGNTPALLLQNNADVHLRLAHTKATGNGTWTVTATARGDLEIGDAVSTDAAELVLAADGTLKIAGDLVANGTFYPSSRALKQELRPVDPRAILERLAALPLSEWSYRSDPGRRHLGPMAEDWEDAFGLGTRDGALGAVDVHGITLAAVQGLHELAAKKDARIAELARENAVLAERLARLEARVAALLDEKE